MKTDEELAQIARAFYDAYMEAKEEETPGRVDALKAQFHGIQSTAAAFMGSLIGDFYKERPWTRFVFFAGIALKSLPLGALGIYQGTFTRQEAVDAWNACGKALVSNPGAFVEKEEEGAGSS
jgi:hypothetical protein